MTIIFLLNSPFPYYTGGRETWIYNITNRMCDKYKIKIISEKRHRKDNLDGQFNNINPKIEIHQVNTLKNYKFIDKLLHSYLSYINQLYSQHKIRKKLNMILKQNQQEEYLIISMDTVFMGSVGRWAKAKYKNVKYISSVRGPHAEITGEYYPLLKKYILRSEIKNLDSADRIWANGYNTQESLRIKGYESIVIKNGVDLSRISTNDNDLPNELNLNAFKVINVGTLLDIKGYNELIKAIEIINQKAKNKVYLYSLGKGNPNKYIKLARELNIEKYVYFLGEDRRTTLCAKKCDIVTCLSGGSGLSMACLESMASGKPVIAWNSSVYNQIIKHKHNGYLVEEKDPKELANGIQWMMEHKDECKKFSKEALNTIKEFDWNIILQDIEKEIKEVLGE